MICYDFNLLEKHRKLCCVKFEEPCYVAKQYELIVYNRVVTRRVKGFLTNVQLIVVVLSERTFCFFHSVTSYEKRNVSRICWWF